MPAKQHHVRLTPRERAELGRILRQTGGSALAHRRARILLHADGAAPGPRLTDREIAAAVAVDPRTVARVRAAWARDGVTATLRPQPRRPLSRRKLDSAGEARLVALVCAAPPAGHGRWTVRLLARTLVVLEVVDSISPETVRQTLKKTVSNPG